MLNRRKFIASVASGLALGGWSALPQSPAGEAILKYPIKAVAFDAFPIFDPRPIFARAERLFPGLGGKLSEEWRTRQFEYTWLRVAAKRYADFWQVTQDALEFAADKLRLKLGAAQRDELMGAYLELKAWPDAPPVLDALKNSGLRLAFLSNFTLHMLEANIQSAGLHGMFEQALSTDSVKTYKPDPRAYQLGTDSLKLKRAEILFVAFAGWDAAGARSFGYPTFWTNRLEMPAEHLDVTPDGSASSLTQLTSFLASHAAPIK